MIKTCQITDVQQMLVNIPPEDLPKETFIFWKAVSFELAYMLKVAEQAREAEVVLNPYRKAGSQYIWEFYVNELTIPQTAKYNLHGQNASQWLYAGCILLDNGKVSTHH